MCKWCLFWVVKFSVEKIYILLILNFSMDKKSVLFVIIIAMLMTLALSFIFIDFKNRITGMSVDTYLENLKLYDCVEAGNWDKENSNYKFTECPDDMIMKGVGIAVTKDALSGGRAYCCKSDADLYDCKEEGNWEEDDKDYELTLCSKERPILKAIGVKIKDGQQAGGKAYCCKSNVELYSCAVTSYWKDTNKNHKLTVCPEDREIMSGIGFNVKENYQYGGKAYCCRGRTRVSAEETEEVGVEEQEVTVSPEVEEVEEEETVMSIITKLFCKIFYSKDKDRYERCVGSS